MPGKMAVKLAIDLLHVPSQVRLVRFAPLPDGVATLLRIAAGDEEAERSAVAASGRSLETVRRSAAFFIEQILFAPDADSYRMLAADPQARSPELRRNVALLLRWLHPDRDPHGARSILASRVTAAWNNLKTPERRAAYDAQLRTSLRKSSRGKNKGSPRGKQKQVGAATPRRRPRARENGLWPGAAKVGFFRRALSMLLQRPV